MKPSIGDRSVPEEAQPGSGVYLTAADRLHQFIADAHGDDRGLIAGPDPGIRFNARAGRFLKSYTSAMPWSDNLTYMQAQGYWILDNWLLHDLHSDARYQDIAVRASQAVLSLQRRAGNWDYPNPEWKGRIATVEGCFASLGLLESFARTGHEPFLTGAKKWHAFMGDAIGYRKQADPGMLAVNYFANWPDGTGGVPNNSTLALWMNARLAQLANDDSYAAECAPMLRWLAYVQRPDGELPYALGPTGEGERTHFLCYQYNAFEFMDLVHYHDITGDSEALPVMQNLANYLVAGLHGGVARYECAKLHPEVAYYTVALAQALSQATSLGFVAAEESTDEAYRHALDLQQPNGSIRFYSRRNYGLLSDRRSYPRYLSMMLHHLVLEAQHEQRGAS